MSLSIVIPWANRPEIKRSLENNYKVFEKNSVELVLVNCGGSLSELQAFCKDISLPNFRIINIEKIKFNKSIALNIGAYYATSPSLFFLDADILIIEDFLKDALANMSNSYFLTVERVVEEKSKNQDNQQMNSSLAEVAYFTELTLFNERRKILLETNCVRFSDGSRSAPGLLFVNKQHFIKVEGMNSNLQYWGWEDLDIIARLQIDLRLTQKRLGRVIHLSHGDEVRNLGNNNRGQSEMNNFSLCLSNYIQGQFKGTYSEDIKTWSKKTTQLTINNNQGIYGT